MHIILSIDRKRIQHIFVRGVHYGEHAGHVIYLVLLSFLSHETYRYGAMIMLVCLCAKSFLRLPEDEEEKEEEDG